MIAKLANLLHKKLSGFHFKIYLQSCLGSFHRNLFEFNERPVENRINICVIL